MASSSAFITAALFAGCTSLLVAAPLSKTQDIDFYRDVSSRNLEGAATRSDGRLLSGPAVTPLTANLGQNLLWSLSADGDKLLLGTGPEGKLLGIDPNVRGDASVETLIDLPETHIFSALRLANGDLLAGTSPQGTLVLAREGKVIARTALPVDSIFDVITLPGDNGRPAVLIGTGNPGRIYRVDLTTFAASGDHAEKTASRDELAARGFTLFGEIRDRNVRRLLRLADGRVIAGSAPKGNVYEFTADAGTPHILAENRNAEVCDLLPWDRGFYAAVTFAAGTGETRLVRSKPAPKTEDKPDANATEAEVSPVVPAPEPARLDRFNGRSQLIWFPDGGFPEVVASRNNVAIYRLARNGDQILIAGGEQGELLGYDPVTQRSLTYAGAMAAQLNGLIPATKISRAFYAIGNNPSGLTLVNFAGASTASAETHRLDLAVPAEIGLLQLGAGSKVASGPLKVEMRASFGSDEVEGWTAWQAAQFQDGGWRVSGLRGRYVQLRLTPQAGDFVIDKSALFYLPQNRRPQLQDFRVLSPNYGLVPVTDSSAVPPNTTLGQLLQAAGRDDDKRRNPFLSSPIIPQPGAQVIVWNATDPDGDTLAATFSIRRAMDTAWNDLVIATRDTYVQFDISHMPEGIYQTRLVVSEVAPRPAADRLSATFETDDLLIDRSPPEILQAGARRENGRVIVTVQVRDALSLLAGVEFSLNNGYKETVEQPDDGILDGRTESFSVDVPADKASAATTIEIIVYDANGNSSARRIPCP